MFGWNVSCAGDINNDGYDDLVIGAPGNDSNGADSGAVYIFLGGVWGFGNLKASNANITLKGFKAGDSFGWAVSCAGDVDKDGYDEVLIGAPGNDSKGTDAGSAYLYHLQSKPYKNVSFTGGEAGDRFGSALSLAGDLNSDGYGDFAIGAYLNDSKSGTSNDQGAVYLYYGNISLTSTTPATKANSTLNWGSAGDWFGFAVACPGT